MSLFPLPAACSLLALCTSHFGAGLIVKGRKSLFYNLYLDVERLNKSIDILPIICYIIFTKTKGDKK